MEKSAAEKSLILIHYSEIGLKKGNRGYFEKKLASNIKKALKDVEIGELKRDYGRFLLYLNQDSPVELIVDRLKKVMGIAHFSLAYPGSANIDELKEQIFERIKTQDFSTFCVRTRRSDKQFPMTSPEINRIVGTRIHEELHKPVDLKNAELTCHIEIYNKQLFFYFDRQPGKRGLPVGASGRVVSLLSAGIDSPVSSYLIMKRGARVIFVHFHSFPMTNKASYHNAIKLAENLTQYQYQTLVYLMPLIPIQEKIILNAPMKLRLILYRRMMLRLAQMVARKERAGALVTGESLGQVASQTLENIVATSESVSMPIFRPLIGMDKEEIIELARKIDTFDVSTEPFDDCCSYMVPENPETKAKLREVRHAEEQLGGWKQILDEIFQQAEVVYLQFP
ncbi:MAG: tRNA 4-thiouridine(8) synthase ThiI [Calditrichaeota bacterium]|nr:tRNA 4-thiouridine(8) synthase ThiI [Calditrichota bacterium]